MVTFIDCKEYIIKDGVFEIKIDTIKLYCDQIRYESVSISSSLSTPVDDVFKMVDDTLKFVLLIWLMVKQLRLM